MSESKSIAPGVVRIRARTGWQSLELRELWSRRELLWFLAYRDLRVRYKQTLLGAGWAILQPLMQMVVFTVFFGGLLNVSSEGTPYAIFSFSALVPWNLFAAVMSGTAGSLTSNSGILTKVYFPRLLIPFANAIARLADFGVALLIVFLMIPFFHIPFTLNMLYLPIFLIPLLLCALGVGLWLGAANVYFRDIGVLTPFFIQLWMFASPVVYSAQLLTNANWKIVYSLNPMAGVLQGFRWCLLGTEAPGPAILISAGLAVIFFVSGLIVFQRVQRNMADVI